MATSSKNRLTWVTRRRAAAHGKLLAAEHLGRRARGTAPPIVDGLAAKDVESHCSDTLCSSDVSQRCAAAPQPGRFRQQFQGNWDLWLGREGSNLRMAESKSAALPLGYAPTGDPGSVEELATADSLRSQPVYRVRRGISTAWRRKIPQLPGPAAPHSIIRPGRRPVPGRSRPAAGVRAVETSGVSWEDGANICPRE